MYEHPYLSQLLTQHDQEQMERAVARRLTLIEHADQIVPRPVGPFRRMLRRVVSRTGHASTARTTVGAPGCEAVGATAR